MYDSEIISSLGPKICNILPTELKNSVSHTIQKENSWMGPKGSSIDVYVTRTYKTMDFYKLPVRAYFAL